MCFAVPCPAGEFSRSGLMPCHPCPRDYYQPEPGKSYCLSCPFYGTTTIIGARSIADCSSRLCPLKGMKMINNKHKGRKSLTLHVFTNGCLVLKEKLDCAFAKRIQTEDNCRDTVVQFIWNKNKKERDFNEQNKDSSYHNSTLGEPSHPVINSPTSQMNPERFFSQSYTQIFQK